MHELVLAPWKKHDFYIMPCVGAGAIPYAWLKAGKSISGGVFCELFPGNLETLIRAFNTQDWEFRPACQKQEWLERLEIGRLVSDHISKRNAAQKRRFSLQKTQKDVQARDDLTKEIHASKVDDSQGENERRLAEPLYIGVLEKAGAQIFLFQGDATSLFEQGRRPSGGGTNASKMLCGVLNRARNNANLHVVCVENLPWGRDSFLGRTLDASCLELMPLVLAEASPGSRSVFIIDRAALVSALDKEVVTRILRLWQCGSIVRLFPLPTKTFKNHTMPMACVFVVRKFETSEGKWYSAVVDFLKLSAINKNTERRELESQIRYYCGLLCGEDMAWGELTKPVTRQIETPDGRKQKVRQPCLFADSILDYQNRLLSDRTNVIYISGTAQNPKEDGKRLLQAYGQLATEIDDRLFEENGGLQGEVSIAAMYDAYRRAVLGGAEPHRYIDVEALKCVSPQQVQPLQVRLLDALGAMLSRDREGNIAYTRSTLRSRPVWRDVDESHRQIVHALRTAALIHRLLVPSFVLEQLAYLNDKYVQKMDASGLRSELERAYKGIDRRIFERSMSSANSGQFPGGFDDAAEPQPTRLGLLPGTQHPVDRMRGLLLRLLSRLEEPGGTPLGSRGGLVVGPCSHFSIPCARRACSPMSVLAIASLLCRRGRIDMAHVLLEGAVLCARLMTVEDQVKFIKSLEALEVGSLESASEYEVSDSRNASRTSSDMDRWAPATVAGLVPMLECTECIGVVSIGVVQWVGSFLAEPKNRGATLTIGICTIAVARFDDKLYLFDPHGHPEVDERAFCIIRSLDQLSDICGLIAKTTGVLSEDASVICTTFMAR